MDNTSHGSGKDEVDSSTSCQDSFISLLSGLSSGLEPRGSFLSGLEPHGSFLSGLVPHDSFVSGLSSGLEPHGSFLSGLSSGLEPPSSLLSEPSLSPFVSLYHAVASEPNYLSARLRVPSGLRIDNWRARLQDYHDKIVCDFIEFGWPIGYEKSVFPSRTSRNHRGALDYPLAIQQYLKDELALGRIAGPFKDIPFPSGFASSPLNTVAKRDSTERRVIVDLSWPCGKSVNDGISGDSFLGESIELTYPTVDAIVEAIVSTGPGCMLYKRDLKKAYRQFPVDPKDYPLLGYSWDGEFYFDTALVMGLRSAAMACQRSTNAVSWIFRRDDRQLFNYLDDFIGVSESSAASSHFLELGQLLLSLGLVESAEKACSPSTSMLCLGVQLDTVNFTMSVDEERLVEIDKLLLSWLDKRSAKKSELQSLVGKRFFVSKCVRQSRVFIARILRLLRTVKFNHHHVNLTAEFRKDILWWCRFLRVYNGVSMINTAPWSAPGEEFSTDACLVGCGGVCSGQFFHATFPPFVTIQDLDINSLELMTIVIALKLWSHRWYGRRLTVRCDNEVAVTVLNSGRCRNAFLNCCLREICYLSATHEFEVRAVHIPGLFNVDADFLSRWDSQSSTARDEFLARAERDNRVAVPVPEELFRFEEAF